MSDNRMISLSDALHAVDALCLNQTVAAKVEDAIRALPAVVPGDDLVAQATAALKCVTVGPWRADGEPWNQIVWSGADNRVCFMAHSNGLDDARDVATARFIAWCREGVPALIATVTAQAAGIEALMNGAGAASQVALDYIARAEAAETALAAMTKDLDELRGGIAEPHDPGDFAGDIYYGHPEYTTLGTHRWTGSEWVRLPSNTEALMALLASARTALAAEREKVARLVEAGPPFFFDRYINGVRMAEDVCVERETTLEGAMRVAARIAAKGPNGEPPVLVYRSTETAARAAIREAGQ